MKYKKDNEINSKLLVSKVSNNRNGHSNIVAVEWGMAVSIDNGPICQVITAQPEEYTFKEMLDAARIDVMSFVTLYHNGMSQNSTYAWLPTQAIEKQIKGYLLKSGQYNYNDIRKLGHGIKKAWREYKKTYNYESNDVIEQYIKEISAVSTNVRYGEMIVGMNDNLLSGLIYIYTLLQHENNDNYSETYYGWTSNELSSDNMLSFNNCTEIFKVYLHLIIEHRLTISPAGICHPHKYSEIDQLKQNRRDSNCPVCKNLVKFDLDELGYTSLFNSKLIAEYFKLRSIETMLNSEIIKQSKKKFSKGRHGFGITRDKNINVHLGKSEQKK
jgi:hypothetical protein